MELLLTGQLAKLAGVNVETIRYYERLGLIDKPHRLESGYRQYTQEYVSRIKFIKRAQGLGFSLQEISELLALRIEDDSVCDAVQRRAEAKIQDIDAKIQLLDQMRQTLFQLIAACQANKVTDKCPILSALGEEQSR